MASTESGHENNTLQGSCDCEVFDKLEQIVASPNFLSHLDATTSDNSDSTGATSIPQGIDAWEALPAGDTANEELQDFVLIDKEDAVLAMAYYLAQCIAQHPEAQRLPPKQLQDAISTALQGLKQNRFKQMCSYGRYAYRWTALSYSALQMYQNPWLMRVIVAAIWTFSRMTIKAMMSAA